MSGPPPHVSSVVYNMGSTSGRAGAVPSSSNEPQDRRAIALSELSECRDRTGFEAAFGRIGDREEDDDSSRITFTSDEGSDMQDPIGSPLLDGRVRAVERLYQSSNDAVAPASPNQADAQPEEEETCAGAEVTNHTAQPTSTAAAAAGTRDDPHTIDLIGRLGSAKVNAPAPGTSTSKHIGKDSASRKRGACSTTDDGSVVSSSGVDSVRRKRRNIFPVRGVKCVACMLGNRMAPVSEFVHNHASGMLPTTLFRMAAAVYKSKIAEPCRVEGVEAPDVSWKDLRQHYTMHCVDGRINKISGIRALTSMRKVLECNGLLRPQADTDCVSAPELDKTSADLYMRILTLESKERQGLG